MEWKEKFEPKWMHFAWWKFVIDYPLSITADLAILPYTITMSCIYGEDFPRQKETDEQEAPSTRPGEK